MVKYSAGMITIYSLAAGCGVIALMFLNKKISGDKEMAAAAETAAAETAAAETAAAAAEKDYIREKKNTDKATTEAFLNKKELWEVGGSKRKRRGKVKIRKNVKSVKKK